MRQTDVDVDVDVDIDVSVQVDIHVHVDVDVDMGTRLNARCNLLVRALVLIFESGLKLDLAHVITML